jgi:methionyl-tRNA formyltransferase
MNIIYFSKGVRGTSCLEYILKAGYQVGAVVAVVPEDDLIKLGQEYKIPILYYEKINSPDTVEELRQLNPDLFVLCGYNKILKMPVISIPALGTINLHGGKLPEYRGAAPLNWQILNGESSGGCSIIYVDEGIDTGDIIAQEIYPITPEDTHASVLQKTLEIFPPLLVKVLDMIQNGTVQAVSQDPDQGGYFGRRYPRDSQINWEEMTDVQVHNLVRAMHGPYPSAFSYRKHEQVEIERTELLPETIQGKPGQIAQLRGKDAVVLAKNRGLLIKEITVNGRELIPSEYFRVGDELGDSPKGLNP